MTTAPYDDIVTIVEEYLGPAASRFVDRHIRSHLHKEPKAVSRKDIAQLADWIRVSLGLLTNDRAAVDECTRKLINLA